MDFINDDENVKAMRETAKEIGVTDLLMEVRREHVQLQSAMDRHRARLTRALMLLGVEGETR